MTPPQGSLSEMSCPGRGDGFADIRAAIGAGCVGVGVVQGLERGNRSAVADSGSQSLGA